MIASDEELIQRLRGAAADPTRTATVLRDVLEQFIDSGELEHGRRLPTERLLAEQLGVTRVVVRNAFCGLERLGAVKRRQGSGTYVQSARLEGNLRTLTGLSEELPSHAVETRTRILQFGFAAPDSAVQRELGVGPHVTEAVRLVRVRYLDGVPSTYEVSWMPATIAAPLLATDLTNVSLFKRLAETTGIRPHHASERLRVAGLDSHEAEALRCSPGSPAFLVCRTTYDADDRPIEYVHTLLRGDRFSYSTTLEAPADETADTSAFPADAPSADA